MRLDLIELKCRPAIIATDCAIESDGETIKVSAWPNPINVRAYRWSFDRVIRAEIAPYDPNWVLLATDRKHPTESLSEAVERICDGARQAVRMRLSGYWQFD